MARAGAKISTPRPPGPEETTLLGGLARVASTEMEERRKLAEAAEDRKRAQQLEDLQMEALQQNIGISRAEALRDIFGLEEVPGTGRDITRRPPLEPRRIGVTQAPGVGLRLGAVPEGAPPGGVGLRIPSRAALPALEPIRVTGQPAMRRLPAWRDPSIVHPELMPTEMLPMGEGTVFDFSRFERQLNLPSGSLQTAFGKNPVGTLNIIVDRARQQGGMSTTELNTLRSIVQTRVQAVSDQMEFEVLSPNEEQQLRDEIDALTIGLLDAATGFQREFDLDDVLDELEQLFPEANEDELTRRAMRIQRVRREANRFAGRGGLLEPGR